MNTHHVTFRLSGRDLAALDALALEKGCSRSEATRFVFHFGLPLAAATHSFNVSRVLLILEQLSASMDLILTRQHADFAEKIIDIAQERVEAYHAQR